MEGEGEKSFFICKIDMSLKAQETKDRGSLTTKQQALANTCIIGIIFHDGFAGRSMAFKSSENSTALTPISDHTELEENNGSPAHA